MVPLEEIVGLSDALTCDNTLEIGPDVTDTPIGELDDAPDGTKLND